jgi:hypothetical protein
VACRDNDPGQFTIPQQPIDLRDYFAGQALVALVINQDRLGVTCKHFDVTPFEAAARLAYMHADAMLKARPVAEK